MKSLLIAVALFALAGIGYAISGNPSSNILYDSANTASEIVARDASGNSYLNTVGLAAYTTAQLLAIAPAQADQVTLVSIFVQGQANGAFTQCVSTGTGVGAWVYASTATASSSGFARACN